MIQSNLPLVGLEHVSIVAADWIGFLGVAIMCVGAFRCIVEFFNAMRLREDRMTAIRIELVKHLSLGLEFLVAKDIIDTIIDPTLKSLLTLSFIIILRTVLAVILNWEIKEASETIEEEVEFEEAIEKFEVAQEHHKEVHRANGRRRALHKKRGDEGRE